MRDKLFRSIAFAVVAAITVGVAPSFAAVDALSDGQNIVADGMFQQKQMRRVYKRTTTKRVASKAPVRKSCGTTIVKERIIEKPVVIEKQVEAPVAVEPAAVEETTVTQPAVVETSTPVIIDRYEKRHRSLIHLGLFPINLLGE
jgi:hypothetical protein